MFMNNIFGLFICSPLFQFILFQLGLKTEINKLVRALELNSSAFRIDWRTFQIEIWCLIFVVISGWRERVGCEFEKESQHSPSFGKRADLERSTCGSGRSSVTSATIKVNSTPF